MKVKLIGSKSFKMHYKDVILVTSILLAAIFLISVAIHSYYNTVGYINNKLDSINISIIEQTANIIENNLSQIRKIAEYIATDEILISYIEQYESGSPGNKPLLLRNIVSRTGIMKQFNKYIYNIVIVTNSSIMAPGVDLGVYDLNYEAIKQSDYMEYIKKTLCGEAAFVPPFENSLTENLNYKFEYIRYKYNFASIIKKDEKEYGCVFILLKPEIFRELLSPNTFLINQKKEVVAVGAGLTDEQINPVVQNCILNTGNKTICNETDSYKMYLKNLESVKMNIAYIQRNSYFIKDIKEYRFYLLVTLVLIILLAVIMSRIISTKIISPLQQLTNSVKSYVYGSNVKLYKKNIKEAKPGLSLRESILVYLIGVVIVPVSIYLVISYYVSYNIIESYIINSYSNVFNQAVENINYFIDTKEKIIKNIAFNLTVQKLLSGKTSEGDISKIVDRALKLGNGRDDVFIYTSTKDIFFTNSNVNSNTTVKKEMLEESQNKRIITTWVDTVKDEYGRTLFNLLIKVNSLEEFNNIGFIQYQIGEFELENIYKNIIKDNTSIFIVNKNGQIISHPAKNMILTSLEEENIAFETENYGRDRNKLIFMKEIRNTPWYLVGQYSFDLLNIDKRTLIYEKIYIFALFLLLTIIIAFIFAFGLTRSLDRINKLIKKMRIDKFNVEFPHNTIFSEINELGQAFNEMVARNEQLIYQLLNSTKKQAELESKKKKSELTALQFQINPHFLYNTFESINWLIKRDCKKEAISMVKSLSQFLRHVARSDDPIVLISEEIQHAKHYINIMKIRYGDQIDFIWDIDEKLMSSKTIRLTLQPVIENAIYHGIRPKQSEGIIEISCRTDESGEVIIFSVTDNGIGIPENILQKIIEEINTDEAGGSIGLHNIQSRIKLYFGEEYGISIFSKESEGTTVEIRIPNTQKK
ncbi:MAG: sensor histidine kinase [Firmicutes bacterium]|nr:sensor histidine kinase [Bacillota bacterium]